jgi:hypothetical protein
MPQAEFEPAIPMFERPKTVLALDRAATETGRNPEDGDVKLVLDSAVVRGHSSKVSTYVEFIE